MNISNFEKVAEVAAEYNTCWREAVQANQAAGEIIKAVRERIDAEKKQDQARMSELQNRCNDSRKSETARRVAALEIERLQSRSYGITDAERDALMAEIENGKQAAADGQRLIPFMRDVLWNAEEELNRVKADTIGNGSKDFALASRWIEGTEAEAAKL